MNRGHGRELNVSKPTFKTCHLVPQHFNRVIESIADMQLQPRQGLSFQYLGGGVGS